MFLRKQGYRIQARILYPRLEPRRTIESLSKRVYAKLVVRSRMERRKGYEELKSENDMREYFASKLERVVVNQTVHMKCFNFYLEG